MDQLSISFVPAEGACRRLIRMVEFRGGRLTSVLMTQEEDVDLARLHLTYADSGCEVRSSALRIKLRTIPGVVDVTSAKVADPT